MKKFIFVLLFIITNSIFSQVERLPMNKGEMYKWVGVVLLSYNLIDSNYYPVRATSSGAIEILWQDPTNTLFAQPFMNLETTPPTTVSINTTLNTDTVVVTSVTGFTTGDLIGLFSTSNRYYIGTILTINTDTLILDTPLDYAYQIGDYVMDLSSDMTVDGSTTPVSFFLQGGGGVSTLTLDITRLIITMTTTDAVDLSTFGDQTALTNGCVLRISRNDGSYHNLGNIKTNGDISRLCYDLTVHEAIKFGENGLSARWTFSDPSKMGAVIRLEPGDKLEFIVQDNLTGILSMSIIAEGHEMEN